MEVIAIQISLEKWLLDFLSKWLIGEQWPAQLAEASTKQMPHDVITISIIVITRQKVRTPQGGVPSVITIAADPFGTVCLLIIVIFDGIKLSKTLP